MLEPACRFALSLLSRVEPRLAVMLFHRVLSVPDPMRPAEPDIARFEAQMRWVASTFEILPLGDAIARLRAGTLPPRALTVSFDDGYRDNLTNALPVMQALGIPFSVFVATGFSNGALMWNDAVIEAVRAWPGGPVDLTAYGLGEILVREDRKAALANELVRQLKYRPLGERAAIACELLSRHPAAPPRLMMTRDELRALSNAGVELGGHTRTHPILPNLDEAEADREIRENKAQLEDITGRPVKFFAYPNGRPNTDYGAREIRLVRAAGYEAALSTAPGAARAGDDLYQLPRFTPWDRTKSKYLIRMVANYAERPQTAEV